MNKLAFLCPGQGAQAVGMGADLIEKYELAKRRFEEADEALGFSISKLCFEGPAEKLQLTANTQPAILTVSVILGELLRENGVVPSVAGGHSLGEYSALVLAGVIDFKDAVLLVHKRGEFMQEAVPVGKGGMAAILGLTDEVIEEVCAEVQKTVGEVQAVNYNCPGQTVIAGTIEGVTKAAEELKAKGAKKAVVLPVSAPFHSSLMKPAAEKLAVEIEKLEWKDPAFPVVANVDGKLQKDAKTIKANLIAQAASPVKWIDCVKTMTEFGADTFIEAGPGKTLAGFNKRIDRKLTTLNAENEESLKKVLDYFKEVG
ncbi:MAG: ACP S-malonyltransferase [Selenomonadaceae bacterium]|nr:ACP S-malonyltransferase [Selenomonadaceae bacterium]